MTSPALPQGNFSIPHLLLLLPAPSSSGFLLLVLTRLPELSVLVVPFSVLFTRSSSRGRPTFLTRPTFLGLVLFSSTLLLMLVEFFKVPVGLPLVRSTDFTDAFDDDEASSEIPLVSLEHFCFSSESLESPASDFLLAGLFPLLLLPDASPRLWSLRSEATLEPVSRRVLFRGLIKGRLRALGESRLARGSAGWSSASSLARRGRSSDSPPPQLLRSPLLDFFPSSSQV